MLVKRVLEHGLDVDRNFLPFGVGYQIFRDSDFINQRKVDNRFGLKLYSRREPLQEGACDIEPAHGFIGQFQLYQVNFAELVVFHWYLFIINLVFYCNIVQKYKLVIVYDELYSNLDKNRLKRLYNYRDDINPYPYFEGM